MPVFLIIIALNTQKELSSYGINAIFLQCPAVPAVSIRFHCQKEAFVQFKRLRKA